VVSGLPYDFPAEHWVPLRTTNPIESTFATMRLRTAKTRDCLSRQTMLTTVFKLYPFAEKRWFQLRGYRRLGEVIENVRFVNGVRDDEVAALRRRSRAALSCRVKRLVGLVRFSRNSP
jgi:hypothetical protein